jgi:hypothetical protein
MAILCRGCVVRIHTICWNIGVWAQQKILHIGRRWEKHLFKKIIHMWRILVAVFSTKFSTLHRSIDTRKDVREYLGNIWAEWDILYKLLVALTNWVKMTYSMTTIFKCLFIQHVHCRQKVHWPRIPLSHQTCGPPIQVPVSRGEAIGQILYG